MQIVTLPFTWNIRGKTPMAKKATLHTVFDTIPVGIAECDVRDAPIALSVERNGLKEVFRYIEGNFVVPVYSNFARTPVDVGLLARATKEATSGDELTVSYFPQSLVNVLTSTRVDPVRHEAKVRFKEVTSNDRETTERRVREKLSKMVFIDGELHMGVPEPTLCFKRVIGDRWTSDSWRASWPDNPVSADHAFRIDRKDEAFKYADRLGAAYRLDEGYMSSLIDHGVCEWKFNEFDQAVQRLGWLMLRAWTHDQISYGVKDMPLDFYASYVRIRDAQNLGRLDAIAAAENIVGLLEGQRSHLANFLVPELQAWLWHQANFRDPQVRDQNDVSLQGLNF